MREYFNSVATSRLAKITVILIFVSPLLFLWTSHEWLYAPLRMYDAYIDLAFSFFYDYGNLHKDYYKAARAPWLILIFNLQKLTGPQLLSPVLTVLFILTVSGLYFHLIKLLFGFRTALLTLPWIIFFPHLFGIVPGGILYNNTAAVCYFLAALVIWSLRSADRGYVWHILLAGAFVASSIFTNVIYLNLLLLFPLIDYHKGVKFRWQNYSIALNGFFIGTLLWGVASYLHGRKFLFFADMFKTVEKYIVNPSNLKLWWVPLTDLYSYSVGDALHMVFLIGAFVTAIVRLLSRQPMGKIFSINYMALLLLWVFWHLMGQTAFHPSDFAYPLQIPLFLMVASWIPSSELTKRDAMFAAASAVVLWLFLYFADFIQIALRLDVGEGPFVLTLIAAGVLSCIFALSHTRTSMTGYLVGLALIYSLTNMEPRSMYQSKCTLRQEGYNAVTNIVANLQKQDKRPGQFLFYAAPIKHKLLAEDLCLGKSLALPEFPKSARTIIGRNLGPYDYATSRYKEINDLTDGDFHFFKGRIVLFPFGVPDFSAKFLEKAASLGFELEKTGSFEEIVMGEKIPYETYISKTLPTN